MNENFDLIRKDGRLLYEYVRGSTLYGLNTPTSDIDTSGVFICNPNELIGFKGYKPQITDSKHDNTWFEFGELIRLLLKSNPTILESLFIPKDKIIGEVHPYMQLLLDNKNEFITKECFNPFFGYAKSQIEKCRGLNKKIVNPINDLLTPFDFIYTFKGQGSTKVKDWLDNHGLKQEFCGLVNIPNMHEIYGLYYDWGAHCCNIADWKQDKKFTETALTYFKQEWTRDVWSILEIIKPIGYRGIIGNDSDEIRLSSIENKNLKPIIFISYNQSGYSSHCRQYKEFKEWEKNRNPIRYGSNLDKTYDSKNVMHCFRLMHMAIEIAKGEGVNLVRTWDKDFLMKVRNHEFEYDEIISLLDEEKTSMNKAIEESTIKEKIDTDLVNDILIKVRKDNLIKSFS